MNDNLTILNNYFSVEANRNYLCRFISRSIQDPQLVDDLAHDTIMTVYKHFQREHTIIKPEQLTGFICHTSKYLIKRNWKSQKRTPLELRETEDIPVEDSYVGLIEFDAIRELAAHWAGWEKSSERHRRWSLLHHLYGLSAEEIAAMEKQRISVDAVRKAIYRIKKDKSRKSFIS